MKVDYLHPDCEAFKTLRNDLMLVSQSGIDRR